MSVRVSRAHLHLFAVLITLMALLAPGAVSAQTSGSLPPLVGQWTFQPGSELKDLTGNFADLQLLGAAAVANGQLEVGFGATAIANSYSGPTLTSKTLVAWVSLDSLCGNCAGSPLSIERVSPHAFDAIVLGERQANRWMAGSDFFHRTQDFSASVTESAGVLHQIAITYEDVGSGNVRITGYRDGVLLGQYTESPLASWQSGDRALFGPRHTSDGNWVGWIDAHVEEARIYAGALTQAQVQSLSFGTTAQVFTSNAQVDTWDPILATFADPNWPTNACTAVPPVGPGAAWVNPHKAFEFGLSAHPWQGGAGLAANWINAWSNLGSQGPGGQSWTKYSTPISGTGDFVLNLLADNCSWIYVDGTLVGRQGVTSTPSTYPVQLSGNHTLTFIIFDGGGLAGGMYRLETNTGTVFVDADGDGLADVSETQIHGTNPNNADTDGDGIGDGAEVAAGTNPVVPNGPPQIALPPGFPPEAAGIITSSFDALTGSVPPGDAAINTQLIAVATALNSGDFLGAETALHALNTAMGAATINGTLTIQQMAQLLTYSGTIEGVIGLGPQLPPEVLQQMTQVNTPMFLGAASLIQSLPGGFQANTGLIQPLLDAGFAITDGNFAAAETQLHQLNQAAGAAMINGTLSVDQMAQLLTYSGTIEGVIGLGPQLPPEVLVQITQVNTPAFLGAATLIQGLPGGFQANTGLIQPLVNAGLAITDGNFAAAETQLHQLNTAMGAAMINGTLTVEQMAQLLTYSGTIEGVIGLGPQLPPAVLYQITQVNTPMFLSAANLIQSLPGGFQANTGLIQPLVAAGLAITDGDFAAAETELHKLNAAMGAAMINGTLSIDQMVQLLTYSGTIEGAIGLGPQLPPETLYQITQVNTPAFLGAAALIQGLPGGFQANTTLIQPLVDGGLAITDGNFAAAETQLHLLNQRAGAALINGTLNIQQMAALLTYSGTIEAVIGLGPQLPPAVLAQITQTNTPAFFGSAALIQGLPGGFPANSGLIQPLLNAGFAITDGNFPAAATALNQLAQEAANRYRTGTLTLEQARTLLANALTIAGAVNVSLNVPGTAPTTEAAVTGTTGTNGWFKIGDPVRLTLTARADLFAVASTRYAVNGGAEQPYAGPVTFGDGAYTVRYYSTDAAGNAEAAKTVSFKIDQTAPTIAGSRTLANAAGWNNTDVTVTFACADGGSDIATCGPTPQVVSTEGANQSRAGSAVDQAGNSASATVGGINIDKTPPVVTCQATPGSIRPPNHKLVDVTVAVTADGGLSGGAGFTLASATSSEPDNGLGDGDTAGDLQGWSIGTPDTSGQVRAERARGGNGRTYTLTYTGADRAGNASACAAAVVVAHDQGRR